MNTISQFFVDWPLFNIQLTQLYDEDSDSCDGCEHATEEKELIVELKCNNEKYEELKELLAKQTTHQDVDKFNEKVNGEKITLSELSRFEEGAKYARFSQYIPFKDLLEVFIVTNSSNIERLQKAANLLKYLYL